MHQGSDSPVETSTISVDNQAAKKKIREKERERAEMTSKEQMKRAIRQRAKRQR